jgi:hypothetical protein
MLRDELASPAKIAFRYSSELVFYRDFRFKTSISLNKKSCSNDRLFHLARNERSETPKSAGIDGGRLWLLPPMHAFAPNIPPTNKKSS